MRAWSLSSLKCYEGCGARYDYRYNQKLPDPSGPAAARGSMMHKAIEDYLTHGTGLVPEVDRYAGFLDTIRAMDGTRYIEHPLAVTADWQPAQWDDAWHRCVIDLYVIPKDSETATKYDWKSGKVYPEHYDQRELYAADVFVHHPEIVQIQSFHTYLDAGKNVHSVFHRSQLAEIQDKWSKRAEAVQVADYTPRPSWGCKWCPYSKFKGGPCRF